MDDAKITFGNYGIVFYSNISTDINIIATRYDGKKTMHYCLLLFVSILRRLVSFLRANSITKPPTYGNP